MKPSSSNSEALLTSVFTCPDVEREVDDVALLRAMLEVEAALAKAEADAGIVPSEAADDIENACLHAEFDVGRLGMEADAAGNPVVPLVRSLGAAVAEHARPWVHYGATSQDVLDTALMLIARRACDVILRDASEAAASCAGLVDRYRATPMVARTLTQQASVTTFGLKAAGWLVALDDCTSRLKDVVQHRIAVQLGGSSGTLGTFGSNGTEVVARLAARLRLGEPVLPWHTDRQRILELAAALAAVIAATGKLALDVELLAQTEIDEVAEGGGKGHGGSSALPNKHNPVDAILIRSTAFRAPGLVSTLFAASQHEHERAAGAWHAEWQPLRELVSLTGGAVARTRTMLGGLIVKPDRMSANIEASGLLVMAENLAAALTGELGRNAAQSLVASCCRRTLDQHSSLREVAMADDAVRAHMSPSEINDALRPAAVLEAVPMLIDRVLAGRPS